MTRTDAHRPGAIVPVLSYSLPTTCGGWLVPSWGINCEQDRRVVDPKTGVTVQVGRKESNNAAPRTSH